MTFKRTQSDTSKWRLEAPQFDILHLKLRCGGQRLIPKRLTGMTAAVYKAGVDPQAKASSAEGYQGWREQDKA
jgi:hypothetical protein